jgi:hypothetical protein
MNFTTDNRWSVDPPPHTEIPESTRAIYNARWIDQGDDRRPDIVPDRQGFAYNDVADREVLIGALVAADAAGTVQEQFMEPESSVTLNNAFGLVIVARRAGGYFYVSAWMGEAP